MDDPDHCIYIIECYEEVDEDIEPAGPSPEPVSLVDPVREPRSAAGYPRRLGRSGWP